MKRARYLLILIIPLVFYFCARGRWRMPEISKKPLSNGLQLYLLQDRSLPLFRATLYFKTGGAEDPKGKSGLASLTSKLLTSGGTLERTPQQVDEWLDQRAISLGSDVDAEITSLTISSLAHQWKESLDFLGEIILNPRWDPGRFELLKAQFKKGIQEEEDEPLSLVSKHFMSTLYGKDHPWGQYPTLETVDKITLQEVKEFYSKHLQANTMILAVTGDFSKDLVTNWFEGWGKIFKNQERPENSWSLLPFENKAQKIHIEKKLTQSFIEVGHLGLERHAPERYAYSLLQYILGGEPFTSRLSKDIRSTQGLAYTVYSHWEMIPVRGYFKIHVETKQEAKEQVLSLIRQHLKRISENGDIQKEELALAKEALLNKYIFLFDSPFKVMATQARLDLLGYPADYLKAYPKNIEKISLEALRAVGKKWLEPDKLKVVVVGP